MKRHLPLLAATCAGLLAGCANWSGSGGNEPQYLPMQGGPGYGPTGPMAQYNAVPEGPPPPGLPYNSDADGAYGGGGLPQSTSYGGSGTRQSSGSAAASMGSSGTGGSGESNPTGNVGGGASGSEATGSAGGGSGVSGSSSAGAAASGAPLDQQSMCELQRRVSAARTPEERQALLEQAMPGMTEETREQHLQMMRESCQ